MGRPEVYTDKFLVDSMESHYKKFGYAKVSSVAKEIGMHRVYLSQRISKMLTMKTISQEQYERWRTPASRAQDNRAQPGKEEGNKKMNITLTPENYKYLSDLPEAASTTINGLINKVREE